MNKYSLERSKKNLERRRNEYRKDLVAMRELPQEEALTHLAKNYYRIRKVKDEA